MMTTNHDHLHASMGPRLFSRGNFSIVLFCIINMCRFNGAAAFQPRKYYFLCTLLSLPSASMGPRLFSRGN